jgi:D-3-phosphoglycerate dehydrogenase
LKGIFASLQDDPVSYVNAPLMAKSRGVEVRLTSNVEIEDHRCVVRIRLTLTDGEVVVVAGTVAGVNDEGRLVQVDGFELEVPISEHMVFLGYIDKPGVVGHIGQLLGGDGINIAGMQVARTDQGGEALTVLTVDSAIPFETMEKMVTEVGAGFGTAVDLD